jgi:hypothetical protein
MVWQKGQSGNPLGAGRNKPWKDALTRALKRRDDGREIGATLEKIADTVVGLALNGDLNACKEIAERHDGKVPQAIVGDDDHAPVQTEQTIIERIIVEHSLTDRDGQDFPATSGTC